MITRQKLPKPSRPAAIDPADWLRPSSAFSPAPSHGRAELYSPRPANSLRRIDLLAAVILFFSALAVRWPLIQRGETLLHSDEAIVGIMAQDIAAARRLPIFFYGQRYMGALEAYVVAALSPLFENPIHALRFGPALFFAAFVALQYLMLTRWFGRRGGLVGAASLLCAAPMFAQWSISARGGYVEILLWGSGLLWLYAEINAKTREWRFPSSQSAIRNPNSKMPGSLFAFGVLLGSGLWINPSIVLFAVPIAVHWALAQPWPRPRIIARLGLAALPLTVLTGILLLNCTWAVWVAEGRLNSRWLLGLLPKPASMTILAAAAITMAFVAERRFAMIRRLRSTLPSAAPVVIGVLIGAAPAALYVAQAALGYRTMEPSLPLGVRPLWTIGSTLDYLIHGLPLLFGADARPFLDLVTIGRPWPFAPLGIWASGIVAGLNWLVLGAVLSGGMVLIVACRREIGSVLRLERVNHPPVTLLLIGVAGILLLYVFSGAAHDFNTIRYLIPIWALLPGLAAAVFVHHRFRLAGRIAVCSLCAAWAGGQYALIAQVGPPHPLRPVADALVARGADPVVAEIFDAHLLTYLTGQRCRVVEYEPFWARLDHFQPFVRPDASTWHLVPTQASFGGRTDWHFPGPPPPELSHPLMERVLHRKTSDPVRVSVSERLPGGYRLLRLEQSSSTPRDVHDSYPEQ